MLRHEATFAGRAIFSGHVHRPELPEEVQLHEVFGRTCPEHERRLMSARHQFLAQCQQRRCAYASAHEQAALWLRAGSHRLGQREAVAKGQHHVHRGAWRE